MLGEWLSPQIEERAHFKVAKSVDMLPLEPLNAIFSSN
jgi:hypothetical protein